jgi:hypothetical protein
MCYSLIQRIGCRSLLRPYPFARRTTMVTSYGTDQGKNARPLTKVSYIRVSRLEDSTPPCYSEDWIFEFCVHGELWPFHIVIMMFSVLNLSFE